MLRYRYWKSITSPPALRQSSPGLQALRPLHTPCPIWGSTESRLVLGYHGQPFWNQEGKGCFASGFWQLFPDSRGIVGSVSQIPGTAIQVCDRPGKKVLWLEQTLLTFLSPDLYPCFIRTQQFPSAPAWDHREMQTAFRPLDLPSLYLKQKPVPAKVMVYSLQVEPGGDLPAQSLLYLTPAGCTVSNV